MQTDARNCRNGGCTRRARGAIVLPVLAALLLPKCPLCAAAYLSLLGLGAASISWLAPALVTLRTCAIVLACGLVATWLWRTLTAPQTSTMTSNPP